MYLQPIKIGSLHINGNIFSAPMSGYTDCVTRHIFCNNGAFLAYTEMISSEALVRNSSRTLSMLKRFDGEKILAVQLYGSKPEILGRAALIAAENGADLIDLNAGCPVRKVTQKGGGAALGRDVRKLGLAIRAMVKAGLPVTVKIRSGWDETEQNWREAVQAVVQEGASAIGFHPRTCRQGYGGKADWKALGELSAAAPVPVIGSGDLDSPSAVLKMLKKTSCSGVMIARGAIGYPEIFSRTCSLLNEGTPEIPPTPEDRLRSAKNHLLMAAETFGENTAARNMKKLLAAYVRGWPSASKLRNDLMKTTNLSAQLTLLDRFIQD